MTPTPLVRSVKWRRRLCPWMYIRRRLAALASFLVLPTHDRIQRDTGPINSTVQPEPAGRPLLRPHCHQTHPLSVRVLKTLPRQKYNYTSLACVYSSVIFVLIYFLVLVSF